MQNSGNSMEAEIEEVSRSHCLFPILNWLVRKGIDPTTKNLFQYPWVDNWLMAIFPLVVELNLVKFCQRFGCLPWRMSIGCHFQTREEIVDLIDMVKLTIDLISRRTSGFTKKKHEESMKQYLRRLTHLYLEDKEIDEIGDDLTRCPNLVVLYLYDNQLLRIPNLSQNTNLTHLYLQNNNISKMENFDSLGKLIKLYIGGNCIALIEGLEKLSRLQELHVENQKLPSGEILLFDPRSLDTVSRTVSVLNVSGNQLTSLQPFQSFNELTQLFASDNQLSDIKELAKLMEGPWRRLTKIDLSDNPICQKSKYRDRIIVMAPSLEILDGKEVTELAKQFLRNWQANKESVKQKVLERQRSLLSANKDGGDDGIDPALKYSRPSSMYLMPALPPSHKQLRRYYTKSQTQLATTTSSHLPPRRTVSDIPRYMNTYGTVYHDTPPIQLYQQMSLLESNSNKLNGY